jgi:hypothetical protein
MSDLYQSLAKATSDKAVRNLLKKMEQQQAEIFLDQFLPLEVPPTEEVEIAGEEAASDAPAENKPAPAATGGNELTTILRECQDLVQQAVAGTGEEDVPTADIGNTELTDSINDAITIAGSIINDASLLAKSGTLDGGDNFKNTLWYKIKKTAAFYTSMLDKKSAESDLSFDEGLAAGNENVQALKNQIMEQIEAAKPKAPEPSSTGPSEEASQDDIDRLLEEMGGD